MSAAFHSGLTHALWLAAYVAGAGLITLVLLIPVAAALALAPWVRHRATVARVRRQTRRSGRTTR
jgi:hypothetical protein